MSALSKDLQLSIQQSPREVQDFISQLLRENEKLHQKLASVEVKVVSATHGSKAARNLRPLNELSIHELDEFIREGMKLLEVSRKDRK